MSTTVKQETRKEFFLKEENERLKKENERLKEWEKKTSNYDHFVEYYVKMKWKLEDKTLIKHLIDMERENYRLKKEIKNHKQIKKVMISYVPWYIKNDYATPSDDETTEEEYSSEEEDDLAIPYFVGEWLKKMKE